MLYFKATGHSKYAYSVTKLLYRIRLQPKHAFKMIWCRFINTRGTSGRNISLDLHMEHINKFLRELLKGLRSNMNEENADRVAKTVKHMMAIVENVENNHDINVNKSKHLQPNTFEDVKKLALAYHAAHTFNVVNGRQYESFKDFQENILEIINKDKFKTWISSKEKEFKELYKH